MTAEPRRAGPVVCDLRAIQSPDHRGRGVGRWSYELATALERTRPDLVGAYLLDPSWPPPGTVDELLSSGKLIYAGSARSEELLSTARLYHCFSPFELGRPIGAVRPRAVVRNGLFYSAVCYDLIPLEHAEEYLAHPAQRRRYLARLEVLKSADGLLAISAQAAGGLTGRLGIPERRCHVVGTGVSRHFVPPDSRAEVLTAVVAETDELNGRFVLYPAGNDGRKNTEGLIEAFSLLPSGLLADHQLVVTGELPPLTANHYRYLASNAGIADRLVLTGFVSDERLVRLYQATELFVFPSFAEGYGLPIAEALACGAVAAVSDRPPFDELVSDERARFDPAQPREMAAVVERLLADDGLRSELTGKAASSVTRWEEVAAKTAVVFEELTRKRRTALRPTRRLAVVSPPPPLVSGVASYSALLLEALGRVAARRGGHPLTVDCFADGLDRYPVDRFLLRQAGSRDARAFEAVDGAVGSYDKVLYVLGNSDCHSAALAALRRRPGTVFTHDVRLSGLMTFSTETRGAVPGGLAKVIRRSYGDLLPRRLGLHDSLSPLDTDRYGLLLLRDLLHHADRVLVTSEAARELAALDAGPQLEGRIGVLPFAMDWLSSRDRRLLDEARAESRQRPLLATFGIVDPGKRPFLLLEAVAELARRGVEVDFAFVGPVSESLSEELSLLAAKLDISPSIKICGAVKREEYLAFLGSATVAVQLRQRFFGEASGAVSECLSAGLPTVVSRLGWMGGLPEEAVAKVSHDCGTDELASQIERLLGDGEARRTLSSAGQALCAERTFDAAAEALFDALEL